MAKDEEAQTEGTPGFRSRLSNGRERFLAHVIEEGLEIDRRTPDDFIRHFPPAAIMNGLEHQPTLRAQILVLTVGVKQKIAIKKSARSAGEDLQIALEEGETDSDSIVALFNPDDRVRHMDAKKLWNYIVEGEFWTVTSAKKEEFQRAKTHIAFMLDRAIQDKLVTHRDIVDGMTVHELSIRLPKDKLGKIIEQALENSRKNQPFTEVDLLTAMPPSAIVDHVPLEHIWKNVVVPKIAEAHGYAEKAGETVKQALDWLDKDKKAGEEPKEQPAAKEEPAAKEAKPAAKEAKPAEPEKEEKGEVEITDDDIRIG